MNRTIEYLITEKEDGLRIEQFLRRKGYSGQNLAEIKRMPKSVLVNGKQINIPSYLVKAGDVVEIKEAKKSSPRYKEIVEVTGGRLVPEWLEADLENLKGTVKELPKREVIIKSGQTLYRFTGSYDGQKSLPSKVLHLMEQENLQKEADKKDGSR